MLKNSFFAVVLSAFTAFSQSDSLDLDAILQQQQSSNPVKSYTYATFKGTKIINGHSIEAPGAGILQFIIYHRFTELSGGAYEFFGLDGARVRMGFDYGISRRLSIGVGRTSDQKTYDGYAKYKFLMQTTDNSMPVSVVGLVGSSIRTTRELSKDYLTFAHRVSYLYQGMIARKFSPSLSLQLTPTVVYTNLTNTTQDKNLLMTMGWGARLKVSKRTAINLEHFAKLPNQTSSNITNVVALGVDIETGGHVFQLHVTNTQGMIEELFIPFNTNVISKGNVNIGFNISRVFTVNKKAVQKYAN
jgi:Membrane bound beta barrel domain (DUF5777)